MAIIGDGGSQISIGTKYTLCMGLLNGDLSESPSDRN